jgi:hypothetical protein
VRICAIALDVAALVSTSTITRIGRAAESVAGMARIAPHARRVRTIRNTAAYYQVSLGAAVHCVTPTVISADRHVDPVNVMLLEIVRNAVGMIAKLSSA